MADVDIRKKISKVIYLYLSHIFNVVSVFIKLMDKEI